MFYNSQSMSFTSLVTYLILILFCELPDVQAGFRKGRGTRNQIANIHWIIKKVREFQKNIYFCLIDYTKPLTVWITTNCGKFFKIWEYQTTWPASWEICIGTQIGKGVHQGCMLSPCLFNLYAEYIMSNAQDGWNTSWNQDCQEKCQ